MVLETRLYFECHVTVEPVFDDEPHPTLSGTRLEVLRGIAVRNGFRVADLLMQKRKADRQERSKDDTFCTARSKSYEDIQGRMVSLVRELRAAGYAVWRYKIEDTVIDSKAEGDRLGIMNG